MFYHEYLTLFSKIMGGSNLSLIRHLCIVSGPEMLPKNRLSHGLVGIGHPVIDYTVPLSVDRTQHLLQTCNELINLRSRDFQTRSLECSKRLFEQFIDESASESALRADSPIVLPGGCTLNALRVAQWLLDGDRATTFIGCIGDDIEGERLNELIKLCGVNPVLQVISNSKTDKSLHISTDDSILNSDYSPDSETQTHKAHKTMDTYQLFNFPGAAYKLTLSTLKQIQARVAITASSYVLTSLNLAYKSPESKDKEQCDEEMTGPRLLLSLSEFASSDNRVFCLRLPSSTSKNGDTHGASVSVKEISAPEWIDLLSNVDILFTDLSSALDVAQTLADWNDVNVKNENKSLQSISRPEIRRRFAEFAASVLLSEKRTPGLTRDNRGLGYASSLYEPIAHLLAATMPGLAERLGFCLANLPKRNGQRARIVIILGAGSASGGIVACTSTGELYRLSDFVLPGAKATYRTNETSGTFLSRMMGSEFASYPGEFLFRGDGKGKCADGFVGGVLAKLMNGSCLVGSRNSLTEAMLVGARVAHLLSLDQACSFPKKLPAELKLAMSSHS